MSTPNRACPECGEVRATGFDITEDNGKVYELRYLLCLECGHETAPRRKYIGARVCMVPACGCNGGEHA